MSVKTLVAAKNVIVADDTAFVRDWFKSALEDAGHRAITVQTGQELLAQVQRGLDAIDLVIVDLRLSGSNGVGLVRKLRQLYSSRPPIVVFSGTIADAGEVRSLGSLGVAGYLNEYTAVQHIMLALLPHLSAEGHTPRKWPRAVLAIPVSLHVANTIATAVTLNVSSGGIAIRTASPLDVGTPVKLRFSLPGSGGEIEATARVGWGDRRIGMGLEFTRIAELDRGEIDGFVQTHFFLVSQRLDGALRQREERRPPRLSTQIRDDEPNQRQPDPPRCASAFKAERVNVHLDALSGAESTKRRHKARHSGAVAIEVFAVPSP
jgi:uncharacterized protein (TIGR02266 family)